MGPSLIDEPAKNPETVSFKAKREILSKRPH